MLWAWRGIHTRMGTFIRARKRKKLHGDEEGRQVRSKPGRGGIAVSWTALCTTRSMRKAVQGLTHQHCTYSRPPPCTGASNACGNILKIVIKVEQEKAPAGHFLSLPVSHVICSVLPQPPSRGEWGNRILKYISTSLNCFLGYLVAEAAVTIRAQVTEELWLCKRDSSYVAPVSSSLEFRHPVRYIWRAPGLEFPLVH